MNEIKCLVTDITWDILIGNLNDVIDKLINMRDKLTKEGYENLTVVHDYDIYDIYDIISVEGTKKI